MSEESWRRTFGQHKVVSGKPTSTSGGDNLILEKQGWDNDDDGRNTEELQNLTNPPCVIEAELEDDEGSTFISLAVVTEVV